MTLALVSVIFVVFFSILEKVLLPTESGKIVSLSPRIQSTGHIYFNVKKKDR